MWFENQTNLPSSFNFITSMTISTRIIHNFLEILLISFIVWSPLISNFLNLITYSCITPLAPLF